MKRKSRSACRTGCVAFHADALKSSIQPRAEGGREVRSEVERGQGEQLACSTIFLP